MAIGEDGVGGGHGSETSTEASSTAEVEAASSSNAANSSSGFASSVLPGVREASRKLQLKMNFRTLSSPKRIGKFSNTCTILIAIDTPRINMVVNCQNFPCRK